MTTDKARVARWASVSLLTAQLLAGCSVMSKSDCENANWRELGQQDAERGEAASRFTQRAEACKKAVSVKPDKFEYASGHAHGQVTYCTSGRGHDDAIAGKPVSAVCQVPAAIKAYRAGYDDGLQGFCTPMNGFGFGRLGGAYRDTCPADSAVAFQVGYRLGSELHGLNRRLEGIASQQAEQRKLLADPKSQPLVRESASRRLGQLDGDEGAVRKLIRQAERDALAVTQPAATAAAAAASAPAPASAPITRARAAELLVGTWQVQAIRFNQTVDLNGDGVKSADAMAEYSACKRDARLEIGGDRKGKISTGANTEGCKPSTRSYRWSVVDAKVRHPRHENGRHTVDERATVVLQLRAGAAHSTNMTIESISADALTVRTDMPHAGASNNEAVVTYTRLK